MNPSINNSVVATDNSTIDSATINSNQNTVVENNAINNSIIAEKGSQITNATIDIAKERRKSFWSGFSIGGIVMSVVASAVWYFIQKLIEM